MRRSWRGIISGALALALLDALVQTTGAAGRVSGWLSGTAKVVNDFLSPNVATFANGNAPATSETQALTTVPSSGTATATPVTTTPVTPSTTTQPPGINV